jgi:hypothetical protein
MPPRIDLTNQKYGRLLVICFSHQNNRGQSFWECVCDCGNKTVVQGYQISSGEIVSCGCHGRQAIRAYAEAKKDKKDYSGQIFGRLKIIRTNKRISGQPITVVAECECGTVGEYLLNNLKRGHTSSCGCLANEGNNTSHGLSDHNLYAIWGNIVQRCCDTKSASYKRYGAKGVVLYDEWRNNFKAFYDWCISNGWKPGLQIDKDIKGNGLLYSPDTCCIVTPKQNSRARKSNVHFTINGVSKILIEWAEFYNIPYKRLHARIKYKKWTLEQAIAAG